MAQFREDRRPIQAPQQFADVRPSEEGDTSEPLRVSLDEFILDRFQTKLEDPQTGRKLR